MCLKLNVIINISGLLKFVLHFVITFGISAISYFYILIQDFDGVKGFRLKLL